MKIAQIYGNRILVAPLDLIKKKAGSLHLPSTGEMMTEGSFYQATVLQLGDGEEIKQLSGLALGRRVLLMKGGAMDLLNGTRVISAEDIIGLVHSDEPLPE